jgi:hypothetical protein
MIWLMILSTILYRFITHLHPPSTVVVAIKDTQASHQTLSMQYRTMPLPWGSIHGRGDCPSNLVRWGTRDVEPLVNAGVDGSRCLVLATRNVERAGVGAIGRAGNSGVDAAD